MRPGQRIRLLWRHGRLDGIEHGSLVTEFLVTGRTTHPRKLAGEIELLLLAHPPNADVTDVAKVMARVLRRARGVRGVDTMIRWVQCIGCKHLISGQEARCRAFPDGIPLVFWTADMITGTLIQ